VEGYVIEEKDQAAVARVRGGFLVTLADRWRAELVVGGEAVGADAEGGGGQSMEVDRTGLDQKRIADTTECAHQEDMSKS